MNERDEARLRHMRDAARKIETLIVGKTRAAFEQDEVLTLALTRLIEIIGEAASRITTETRVSLPQIPWNAIIGMRNRIVHDYLNVDSAVVWDTATLDLPPLLATLEELLPPEGE